MSFDTLSNELVAEIFRHLGIKDLARVSLCCRRLHDIAEPYLYSGFVQTGKQAMPTFLRTLIDKPYLGSTINSEFYRGVPTGGFDLADYLKENPGSSRWIREQLPQQLLWPSRIDVWHRHLSNNFYWDPIAALILVLCSESLESINMVSYGSEVADWIDYLLQQVATAQKDPRLPKYFPKLRKIELTYWDTKGQMNLDYILPYLKLKTVAEFKGGKIGSHVFPGGLSRFDDVVFTTNNVSLTQSNLKAEVMRRFCSCFYSLKRFEYQHAGVTSGGLARFLPSAVREGLQNSKHCLEELILMNTDERWDFLHADTINLLGPLTEFQNLRSLDADSRTLLGLEHGFHVSGYRDLSGNEDVVDEKLSFGPGQCEMFVSSLPTNLEHLTIRECTSAIYDCVAALFLSNGRLPAKLKALTLEFRPGFSAKDRHGTDWEAEALRHRVVLSR